MDAVAAERTHAQTPPALRDKLKQATTSAHRSLDARLTSFDLTNIDGYRRFLEANAAALLPLETALEDAGVSSLFPDWPERSRRAAILSDLGRVDGAVHPLRDVAPLDRNAMLGTMYVLEGSRLGAKYLLRMMPQAAIPRSRRRRAISATARACRYGGAFFRRWSDQPVTPQDEAAIIAGAHLAFAMFAEAAALCMNEQVNLSNCDREPIHIPGSVQPFGFLLTLLSDFTICMASENAGDFLGADCAALLRKPIVDVLSESAVERDPRPRRLSQRARRGRADVWLAASAGKAAIRSRHPFLRRLSRRRGRAERHRARRQFRRARPPDAGAAAQDQRIDRTRARKPRGRSRC